MGIASLVIGILAIILGFVPGCGIVTAVPAAILGIILGVVEIALKSKKGEPKGMGTAGLILNIIAIVIVVVVTAIIMPQLKKGMEEAVSEIDASRKEFAAEMEKAAQEAQESVPAPPADE